MIPKSDLEDRAYYRGQCRNAQVAQWHADKGHFMYMRSKFGNVFVECINHPEDDNGYDLFRPEQRIHPQ